MINNIETAHMVPSPMNDNYNMPQTNSLVTSAERCARWESGQWFRVELDLRPVCGDERARSLAWVCARRRAAGLLARARRLLAAGTYAGAATRPLGLLRGGRLLPPAEPLALLDPDDVVQVVPLEYELPIEYEEESDNEDTYCTNCSAKKKNTKHDASQNLNDHIVIEDLTTKRYNFGNERLVNSHNTTTLHQYMKNNESSNKDNTNISDYQRSRCHDPPNEDSTDPGEKCNVHRHRRFTFSDDDTKHKDSNISSKFENVSRGPHPTDESATLSKELIANGEYEQDEVDALDEVKRNALKLLDQYDSEQLSPARKRRRVRRRRKPVDVEGRVVSTGDRDAGGGGAPRGEGGAPRGEGGAPRGEGGDAVRRGGGRGRAPRVVSSV